MASPVVGRKSKAETMSTTIQEAEEEEQEEEQEEEEEGEKKQEKQFLKTNSLASLLPRLFAKCLIIIRCSPLSPLSSDIVLII